MRQMRRWALTATVLAAAVAGGCSRATQSAGASENPPASNPVALHVQNNNFADMNVFVIDGGMRRRIGFVPGESTADLSLGGSYRLGTPVQLIATAVGGAGVARSNPVTLFGGETVTFTIQPDLVTSYALVQ